VTISPNGKYIVSFIPVYSGSPSQLIVFSAIDHTVISARGFPYSGVTTSELRALLINSAGTSGFLMDFSSYSSGSALYRYNPMSKT
jgi:hypothetical protein